MFMPIIDNLPLEGTFLYFAQEDTVDFWLVDLSRYDKLKLF